jgi:hypothetical protein
VTDVEWPHIFQLVAGLVPFFAVLVGCEYVLGVVAGADERE